MNFAVALVALLVERFIGYPEALAKMLPHPVTWMGALISRLDTRLNAPGLARQDGRAKGLLMVALLIAAFGLPSALIALGLRNLPLGWLAEALLAAPFLAQKELARAVNAVAEALSRSLDEGRAAVSQIVGRDTHTLDESGVARAAIESLAENSSDGVVAPLFFLLLGGLPGIVIYKAINTADSMVGHRDERYLHFGWASARLDDLVNLIPARATALLIGAVAWLVPGADGGAALRAAWRDAPRHVSPNAGWPEAAMAGALGLTLGGPKSYEGRVVELPKMGDGRAPMPADIPRALALYRAALLILIGLVALTVLFFR